MSPFRPTLEPIDRVRMDDGREVALVDWVEDMLVLDALRAEFDPECAGARVFLYGLHKKVRA